MPHKKRRSLRARMITLVLVPSITLLTFWALLTVTLIGDIRDLRATATLTEEVGPPVVDVITQIQRERRTTMEAVNDNAYAMRRLDTAREDTDQAVERLSTVLQETPSGDLPDQILTFRADLEHVGQHRESIDSFLLEERTMANSADPYTEIIEQGLRFWDVQIETAEPAQVPHLRSLAFLVRTRELLNQQSATLAYAVATKTFDDDTHNRFTMAAGAQQYTWERVGVELSEEDREEYLLLDSFSSLQTVYMLQESIGRAPVHDGASAPANTASWWSSAEDVDLRMREVEESQIARVVEFSNEHSAGLLRNVLATSLPALLVAALSIAVAVRGAQSVVRRLQKLRTATLEHARVRLPEVTARLRTGGSVDVDTEVPRLYVEERDEIGQVTEAFNDAQRAAVAATVEEAQLRTGVRNMFRNIARRTQALVHRQLGLLDTLERNETDPKVLESLFRIDHFSTQMRRNAENLMLLSGDAPARGGREPVQLYEVVRAAASEIEDYTRVRITSMPSAALRGDIGADTVRLLAELLENATTFSPPGSPVTVSASKETGGCFRLQVEDRGLGMTPSQLERANILLADPPRFDLALVREDSQLGLFVVATIAARHGFEVTVQPSAFKGTCAEMLIPAEAVLTVQGRTGPEAMAGAQYRTILDERKGSGARTATREPSLEAQQDVGVPSPPAVRPKSSTEEQGSEPSLEVGGVLSDTYKGLPRRRRKRVVEPQPAVDNAAEVGAPRSLSEIRSMMSAFQSGTERGRSESFGRGDQGADEKRRGEEG